MVHEEGFRRLRIITSVLLKIGLGLTMVWIVSTALSMLLSGFGRGPIPEMGILLLGGICMYLVGGFLKIVIWVAEGFVCGPKIPQQ